MEPISFTSKLTFKEYVKYALSRFFQSWVIWFIYIVCVCVIFLSVFSDNISGDNAVMMIVGSILVMIIIPIRTYFRIRKAYKSNPFSGMEIYWTISESGIAYKQGSASVEVGWDRVVKISDTKKWIMLWNNSQRPVYFQKHCLSPSQIASFKKIIHQMRKGYLKY